MLKKAAVYGLGIIFVMSPALVLAQTFDVQAQIAALLAQIKQLQALIAQLQGQNSTSGFCHNFNTDLKFGDASSEVGGTSTDIGALMQALKKEGLTIDTTEYNESYAKFGESTAEAVVKFQAKYGIKQTGYVGPLTRNVLNSLYSCHNSNFRIDSISPASSAADGSIITIQGSGFNSGLQGSNAVVDICGGSLVGCITYFPLTVSSDGTRLTFKLSSTSIPEGTYRVKVGVARLNQQKGFGSVTVNSNSIPFTVRMNSLMPVITSTSAKAAGNLEVDAGGEVSIYGSNLATVDSTHVYIGGIQATVTWTSESMVSARVPSSLMPGQSYDLYITNQYGTSNIVRVKVLSSLAAGITVKRNTDVMPMFYAGSTNAQIGSYIITATSADSVNLSSMTLYFRPTGSQTLGNVRLFVGGTQFGQTRTNIAGIYDVASFFSSVPVFLFGGTSVQVDVWADILPSAQSGPTPALTTLSSCQGTAVASGATVNCSPEVNGWGATFVR